MELWVDIEDFPNYQVSNKGRVRNKRNGYILKPFADRYGYLRLSIGNTDNVYIHKLVCQAFNGNPPNYNYQINHIDSNRQNNCASNLEWVTHQDNIRYSSLAGRYNIGKHRGSHNGRSKLCEQDVAAIRQMLNSKMPVSHLARQFGVGWTTIQHIKNGDTWVGI